MPVRVMALLASPRSAKPGPETTGVTATTSGSRSIWVRIVCHWSIERKRWERGCTFTAPPSSRSTRATCSGGSTTMGACEFRVRRMILDCKPESKADMNTITATPSATPAMISRVCDRPSRIKRNATTHSNGSRRFIADKMLKAWRRQPQRHWPRWRGHDHPLAPACWWLEPAVPPP